MKFPRSSGILLHITSLPGRFGIGDLGPSAFEFADFLSDAGQKIWQVLPLNPTGYGDSPYQCFSAFAGNPLLISLERLLDQGILQPSELAKAPSFPQETVDFGAVINFKFSVLRRAAQIFFSDASSSDRAAFDQFCKNNAPWLDDYALFMAVKDQNGGIIFTRWEPAIRRRDPDAVHRWSEKLAAEIHAYKFWQFEFFRQWERLKSHCQERAIRFMGDIPIYVAHDSADVWSHPDLFYLNSDGSPTVVSGVPPDYFSATGQLWGNPIYRWDLLAASGYHWWIERFRASLALFDMVRLDHFRGFEAYWEVPATETTAINGRWVKGPGEDFFLALQKEFGDLPIVAENLGVITPPVEKLRQQFHLPGMSLLQFAFGNDPQGPSFRPHNYHRDLAAYTGGHDNDTTVGWWHSSAGAGSTRTPEDIEKEHAFARAYLNFHDDSEINWVMIRAVIASVAEIAIVPMQDVLGLGTEARMNLPATMSGNWRWRYRPGALTKDLSGRLRELGTLYDR
ncbi:MAG TPA: 4-alpha-glucanotransferase [Terriglobales bacterium]|nr:4-alpha-glucanotransferase [Terriglobales bacterium]